MSESIWEDEKLRNVLILKHPVSDNFDKSYKWQHEATLEALEAALGYAVQLVEEKIQRMEKRFELEDDEYPGDATTS
jgi:DNA-directed RNA polymerase subunit L